MPTFTGLQREQLRELFGYSKLFASSNAIFENALDTIQTQSDPSAFNQVIVWLNLCLNIDQQIANNTTLGLATNIDGKITFDAYRNDVFLRRLGRSYIHKLSFIISMKPAEDYYGRSTTDRSGNVYPTDYNM